jgi:drug/metabolite transporter (DMT)-like permease
MKTMCRSRWFVPLFTLALGGVVFGAQAIGGHPGDGLVSLGILAAAGGILLFGGRSETIRALRGDGRDERFQRIDIHATAFAGTVVIVAVIVGFVVELAHGRSGNPFTWLGALGGFSYMAAIVVMRLRG